MKQDGRGVTHNTATYSKNDESILSIDEMEDVVKEIKNKHKSTDNVVITFFSRLQEFEEE